MRIVNLETFRKFPPETLFAKYSPCVFGELQIKGETWDTDFLVTSDIASAIECDDTGEFTDLLHLAETTGASLAMDFETLGRDGCFNRDQLFAVFEPDDVRQLIDRLSRCIA